VKQFGRESRSEWIRCILHACVVSAGLELMGGWMIIVRAFGSYTYLPTCLPMGFITFS
jgi:hypothetical protein